MRPDGVVGGNPGRNDLPSLINAVEQSLVEQFIAHPPIEVFHIAVLHRPALSDVGSYIYPTRSTVSVARPHAVTEITSSTYGNKTFNYDANGNMVDGNGRHYNWTAFDQPLSINNSSHTATFKYSAEHHRIRQTINAANATEYYTDTVTGARSERLVDGSNNHQRWIDYVVAGDSVALTISTTETTYNYASSAVTRTWQHRDHLGSTTLTTNAAGLEDRRMAYDAWGKRRNTDGSANPSGSLETSGVPNRGFTDHEHLEEFGLIHMNGRIYDPVVARFVSADPIIDDPYSVQAFNRYSYVGNNPLTYTDPTGYLKLGRIFRMAFAIALAVIIMQPQIGLAAAMGLSTTQGAILAGAVAGAISTGSIQGAVMGGLSGGLFAGIAPLVGQLGLTGVAADVARIGFSGVVGGVMSVMQGGKFGSGFLAAGITATFAPGLEKIGNIAARTAVGAVIGGIASVAGGGKFENGAMTGAFQALFTGVAGEAAREAVEDQKRAAIKDRIACGPATPACAAAAYNALTAASVTGASVTLAVGVAAEQAQTGFWDRLWAGIKEIGSVIMSTPSTGEPGTWVTNPGSGQERLFGADGKPAADIDWDHHHGQGQPHAHNWKPRPGGGFPEREPGVPVSPWPKGRTPEKP